MRKNMKILGKLGIWRVSCWTDAPRSAAIRSNKTHHIKRRVIACAGRGGWWSYARKLVTEPSGGVFGLLDAVPDRRSFDDFSELV
jgi:hypothetical protein